MPYGYDMQGRLHTRRQQYPSYENFASSTPQVLPSLTTDPIRLAQFYVESDHEIKPGHAVQWTGQAAMVNRNGERIDAFSQSDMSQALSSVEPASGDTRLVAGVVIEKAAAEGDTSFTHKGIHTTHSLPADSKNYYRVGNDIVLAWVLEESEGELEGIYERYVNGTRDETGPYQLTMVASDMFMINRTMQASIDLEFAELKARFDALTIKTE